jgi:hypothetical protein
MEYEALPVLTRAKLLENGPLIGSVAMAALLAQRFGDDRILTARANVT